MMSMRVICNLLYGFSSHCNVTNWRILWLVWVQVHCAWARQTSPTPHGWNFLLPPTNIFVCRSNEKKNPAISDRFADSLQRKRQSLQLERNRSRLRCFKANLYEQQSLMYVSEATGLRARYGINGASLRALWANAQAAATQPSQLIVTARR